MTGAQDSSRTTVGAEAGPLTREERRLRWWLFAHAAWSAALAINYLLSDETRSFGFIPNSFSKDALFVALSLLAAWNIRRFGWLTLVIVVGYVGLVLGQASALWWGNSPDQFGLDGTAALLGWMAIDLALIALFTWLWWRAVKARWGLLYLNPIAFLSLISLGDVLIEGRHEAVPPQDIARNVDDYLANLEARGKRKVQLGLTVIAIWPIFSLPPRPPLPLLDPISRKKFLERRFISDVAKRRGLAPLRTQMQAMIRLGSQMAYLGYYGDRRSWPEIKYRPYGERPGALPPDPAEHPHPPLRPLTTPPRNGYDTIVVGSGAAGGLLAYRCAEKGRRVLVLERGPHVDPRDFTDNEVQQYLRLYNAGALQIAVDFRFQVLQGMCVGGGTTVNNALCLDPPGPVLDDWQANYGIDRTKLGEAIGSVRELLPVGRIDEAKNTTKAARRFAAAAEALPLPGTVELMEVNISDGCRGCGYCNIGCRFGAKLSMLDTLLPRGQHEHGLDVLPDFEVTRIAYDGAKAIGVHGRYDGGDEMFIRADREVIVAAGALHSSLLLKRSGVGGDLPGRGLHFNINSPLTADFPDHVDAFAGLQMSHAYSPNGDGVPGYLLETWFNPPATQALSMPGWFGNHFRNMLRYRHMASGGVLVGTTRPGYVWEKHGEPQIDYKPSPDDLHKLVEGLKVMGRIYFEAGATRVMPATYAWHEFRKPEHLHRLDRYIKDNSDLLLTTAHPQGGNAIGAVVDPDFRVKGFDNLILCDASVFPTSVHVNPQLTVMGMAELAARTILR